MGKKWKKLWLLKKIAKQKASVAPIVNVEPVAVVPDAPEAPVVPVEAVPEPVVEEEVVVPKKRAKRTRKTKGKK